MTVGLQPKRIRNTVQHSAVFITVNIICIVHMMLVAGSGDGVLKSPNPTKNG